MTCDQLKADPILKSELILDEGYESKPYKDTMGYWTAGIGHNLDAHGIPWAQIAEWQKTGVPAATISEWFTKDVEEAISCCVRVFEGFETLPDNPQRVLVDMAFDLMYRLYDWPDLIKDVEEKNWRTAAGDILRSRFAQEDPPRCRRLANRMQAVV